MTLGEGHFHDVCLDADPAAHIRSMCDAALRILLDYLVGKNQTEGVAGEIWATCLAEAARRFMKGGRP